MSSLLVIRPISTNQTGKKMYAKETGEFGTIVIAEYQNCDSILYFTIVCIFGRMHGGVNVEIVIYEHKTRFVNNRESFSAMREQFATLH